MRALFRLVICLLPLAALAAATQKKPNSPEGLGFYLDVANTNDLPRQLDRAASIYIAPWKESSFYLMRYPTGEYREFQNLDHLTGNPIQRLWNPSAKDWQGGLKEKEGLIWIQSSANVVGGMAQFLFKNGRLIQFEQGGRVFKFPYEVPRQPTAGGAPSPPPAKEEEIVREMDKKWKKSGRLRWPFKNPNDNGFLFAALALFATALFYLKPVFGSVRLPLPAYSGKKEGPVVLSDVQIAGGLCFLAAIAALVLTESRGALLGLACGLVPAIALNFRKVIRSRAVAILVGLVLIASVAWFATHGSRMFTRGFKGESKWSNDSRLEKLVTAPKMVAEAPNGWESMHVDKTHMAGRAYMDWYDDLSVISLPFTLVSDHLSFLVGHSLVWRYVYLFVWFGLLALLTYTAVQTKRAVSLGVFVAIAVSGLFNEVLVHYLWCIPAFALGLFVAERPWRFWRFRTVGLLVGGAAVLAAVVLSGIYLLGNMMEPKRGYPIHVANGQVLVKGTSPGIWIVDDNFYALGEALSCRDIRRYYAKHPSAPPIGYVRSLQDLPREKVKRLVLSGTSGIAWLEWLRQMAENGTNPAELIPEELVFIAPTILPSELPPELVQSCKAVRYVIGEFVARYHGEEFIDPPQWVTVVPGMEIYIKNWMRFAVE